MKILLKEVDIITGEDDAKVINQGYVGIEDGNIVFVEEKEARAKDFYPDKVIEGKNKLLMPGLVNAHTHSAMTLLRNYADDLALEDWLFQKIFPKEALLTQEDIYWGTLLGIGEMINSGTATFADMYLHMDWVAKAVTETGIRANLSRTPFRFIGGEGHLKIADDREGLKEYFTTWHKASNGRIKVFVEVHSVYIFHEENLRVAAQLAKELGTGIQIHVLETKWEREESIKKYGMNSAEACSAFGIFDVPVIAAHCVHLENSDIALLKEKGVSVAHNPTSNLKLGSGIARIPEILRSGINVCLGTDGTASNNNLNMFEEMHLAALLSKGVYQDATVVNAQEVIKMATTNGAKALGFEGETGLIKEGMKADVILLDTDKAHLCPLNNPLSAVVYAAQASDVDTVIIDGNIVMENRQLCTIDEEKVKFHVREIAKRIGA